jgi:hypothetical protein
MVRAFAAVGPVANAFIAQSFPPHPERIAPMAESEIPASVMYIAGEVVADIFHDVEMMHPDRIEEAARPIAEAIMAERERCAQIAENNDHFPQEGEFIARLIRQDNPNAPKI